MDDASHRNLPAHPQHLQLFLLSQPPPRAPAHAQGPSTTVTGTPRGLTLVRPQKRGVPLLS